MLCFFFDKCATKPPSQFSRSTISPSFPPILSCPPSLLLAPTASSLSSLLSLSLSPRLTEADVGQCVWSLSGAAESIKADSAIAPQLRTTFSRLPEDKHPRRLTWRALLEGAPATGEWGWKGGDVRHGGCMFTFEKLRYLHVCCRCKWKRWSSGVKTETEQVEGETGIKFVAPSSPPEVFMVKCSCTSIVVSLLPRHTLSMHWPPPHPHSQYNLIITKHYVSSLDHVQLHLQPWLFSCNKNRK